MPNTSKEKYYTFYEFSGTIEDYVNMQCGCRVAGKHTADGSFEFHFIKQCPIHALAPQMYEIFSKLMDLIIFYGDTMDWGDMPAEEFIKTLLKCEAVLRSATATTAEEEGE